MSKIKLLSDDIINKIAAGEVVERPFSVVKELVENAIDAKATKIDITLECAGKNLISIQDNGTGMSKEDLYLAISRHATSKLDEQDLFNINSFGFRGEALPSIASISRFSIESKRMSDEFGHKIYRTNNKNEIEILPNIPNGTKVIVADLFFTTPARLKFLKSDKQELSAITNLVKKIAISNPTIEFSLTHNNRKLFNYPALDNLTTKKDQLYNRIAAIYGNHIVENLIYIDYKTDDKMPEDKIHIYGYTSLPTLNRATGEDQILFVNNRPVKDKILPIALKIAYQDVLISGRYPIAILFIDLPNDQVDVNAHPAKTEVRFVGGGEGSSAIRKYLIKAVKTELIKHSQETSSTIANDMINHFKPENINRNINNSPTSTYSINSNFTNSNSIDSIFEESSKYQHNTYQNHNQNHNYDRNHELIKDSDIITNIKTEEDASNLESANHNNLHPNLYPKFGFAKCQLHKKYIISQKEDSLLIIDQHALHERIGYEKMKQKIKDEGLKTQILLIPPIVKITDNRKIDLLKEYQDELAKISISYKIIGDDDILIKSIPSILVDIISPEKLLLDVVDILFETGENIAQEQMINEILSSYSCHYAIRAGKALNIDEMNELLKQMESTLFSGQCNHGRPTYIELKLKDIDKLFARS